LSAQQAGFLKDSDRILGVSYKGESRAYPIRILNWHEIVNDKIQGDAIAVTYCPLCGSGIVYNANINGESYEFGVSGLLYNSDMLLYDRETETLWSQILAKAVSGKLVGTELEIIQSSHTSWKAWKEKHPDSKVLSLKTGYSRPTIAMVRLKIVKGRLFQVLIPFGLRGMAFTQKAIFIRLIREN